MFTAEPVSRKILNTSLNEQLYQIFRQDLTMFAWPAPHKGFPIHFVTGTQSLDSKFKTYVWYRNVINHILLK